MSWIHAYGCVAATGNGVDELWSALKSGRDDSTIWPEDSALRAFLFRERTATSIRSLLGDQLMNAFAPIADRVRAAANVGVTGVILASTKGMSNDFIWQPDVAPLSDPLTPLLHDFLRRSELAVTRSLCLSNACSSTLAALALGQLWLRQGMAQVLIVSADAVTPFVVKGFRTLKLISEQRGRPFAAERNGFLLGEAAAAILLTASRHHADDIYLHEVGLDSEGSAVTRPSHSGESVRLAACRIPELLSPPPQVIIAHGTGTPINDATEDLAFARVFAKQQQPAPLITGTKWCVGHTLAASGALDIVAGCEALRRQQLFSLFTTVAADPSFTGRYFTNSNVATPISFARLLVSSLGFGGMHASALLERRQ
jgi:hypothetical protein